MRSGCLTTFIIQLQQTALSNCINYSCQSSVKSRCACKCTCCWLLSWCNTMPLIVNLTIHEKLMPCLISRWTIGSMVLFIMHYGIHSHSVVVEMCTWNHNQFFWLSILMCTSEQIIALIRETCRLESWSLFNGISRAIFNFIRLHNGLECEHWNLQQNFYQDLFILLSNMTLNYSTLWKQCSRLSASFANTQYNPV